MDETKNKKGFTLIEVMIFLAISGLLLIGVLGGTYVAIASQRYNDSVRSFSEFLRQLYGEVISPESFGQGNSDQNAIYGKIAVFGLEEDSENKDDLVYTATIVGDTHVPAGASGFMDELKAVNARLFCGNNQQTSTVETYAPTWDTKIQNTDGDQFTGTVIIARSPASGTVHTAYTTEQFNIREYCDPGQQSASTSFREAIQNTPQTFTTQDIDFCLLSENSVTLRDVRLIADGRNNSAVNILDEGDSPCRRH